MNCLSNQAQEGWLSLRWFWAQKLEHTNRGRRELLACRRRAPGVPFIGQAGRPGPTGLGWFWLPWLGSFSQHDHLPFVTFVPACSTSCTAQTLSSTPLLALLVLPLDALALSHVHAPLVHLLHMPPLISYKVMLAAHPCLSFACGLDESCWEGI
jgi:hypothetical protein